MFASLAEDLASAPASAAYC